MPYKLLLILYCFMATSFSFANGVLNVEQNIKEVNHYFFQKSKNLPYEKIISLSIKVLESRENYTSQTLGKTFILLADIANSKGEIGEALQFAQNGLSLPGLGDSIKFNLLLKTANSYCLNKKYHQGQNVATNVILMTESPEALEYRLLALSYRSVNYALQNKNVLAMNDLNLVDKLISANPQYQDHPSLLEILATAHYNLGDYKTSLTMQNKLLTLKFDLEELVNIDRTYLHIARTYFQLNLLDDAYNAYWQAHKYSKDKNAPIRAAYAELGLAEVLLKQNKYRDSHDLLLLANAKFNENSLSDPYLTSLILLAETALFLDDNALYLHYLQIAELMAKNVELSEKQSKLLLLLSDMYQQNGDFKSALLLHQEYLEIFQRFQEKIEASITTLPNKGFSANVNNRQRTPSNKFNAKYIAQQKIVYLLIFIIIILLVTFVYLGLKQRTLRLIQVYDEVEQPLSFLATPSQTKRNYQLTYKMARKYNYPLAVGYLSVINWQELSFHFDRKIMFEVSKTLATLLNESKGEFDEVGEINEGEYLLLGPHQTEDEIATKLNSLAEAIKVRFFANLGDYSVKIGYAYGLPTAQDIDPYIFLSRLSETTKA